MSTPLIGIVTGPYTIQVDAVLPYEEGEHVSIEIEPISASTEDTTAPVLRRLWDLVGISSSGIGSVAEGMHS